MGNVFFDTQVNKNVNISKNVLVDVGKNVEANVNLDGSLASAEASADAVGGGRAGVVQRFFVDVFLDTQFVQANAPVGPDPVESTIGIAITDIPDAQRRLFVDVLNNEGIGQLGVNTPVVGLDFSSTNNAFTNALVEYTSDDGAFDITPGVDNADILADDPVDNVIALPNVNFDPGIGADGQPATVRVSVVIEDDDGNQGITTVALVPGADGGGFEFLTIVQFLAGFIDNSLAIPPGTVLGTDPVDLGEVVVIGTATDGVNLDEVRSIQILLEDRPNVDTDENDFNSADFFAIDSVIDENLSVDRTHVFMTPFITETRPEPEDVFNIAETETFAQVAADAPSRSAMRWPLAISSTS